MPGNKRSLVLDTWVIAKATSEKGEEVEEISKAQYLLQKIYHHCHIVLLDLGEPESQILGEWNRYLWATPVTRIWYAAMNASGKFGWRNKRRMQLPRFFDPNDEKFVQLAVTTSDKVIITGEEKFTNWGRTEEARNLGVKVWDLEKALQEL